MDFGALVSTTFDKVDKDVYPLIECLWFQTQGKNEIQEKKTKKNSLRIATIVSYFSMKITNTIGVVTKNTTNPF